MSKQLQEAHISLHKDNSIIVTKPDKGNGVVLLNRTDYVSKMEDILSDASKFSLSSNDDNLQNLTKFQRFLYRLQKNYSLSEEDYHRMYPTSASTPSLHGLPKTHKPGNPMRPIISAVGSFNHEAAKWLSNVLAPLRHHSTVVRDTFSFVKDIQNTIFEAVSLHRSISKAFSQTFVCSSPPTLSSNRCFITAAHNFRALAKLK